MGAYKDLAIELHNQQIRRPLRLAIYDHPNAGDHITTAIDHLEQFILPDVTDRISYDFIVSQLRKAIAMIEGEN